MNNKNVKRLTALLLACAVIGFGSVAFANPGSVYRPHWRGMGPEPGYGSGRGCGRDSGYQPADVYRNLSDEDRKKLDQARKDFREATRDLKQQLRKTRFELKAELSGKTIDGQRAAALLKKISDLQAQLDLKRLEHLLKIKEMFPDLDDQFAGFCFKGRGSGRGSGYGGCR